MVKAKLFEMKSQNTSFWNEQNKLFWLFQFLSPIFYLNFQIIAVFWKMHFLANLCLKNILPSSSEDFSSCIKLSFCYLY